MAERARLRIRGICSTALTDPNSFAFDQSTMW